MHSLKRLRFELLVPRFTVAGIALGGLFLLSSVAAAQGIVLTPVQVSDAQDRPIPRVVLSAKGDSSTSPPTDKAGKTHLALPSSITPGSEVSLVLVDSPLPNLKFLSPWQGRATVPLRDAVEVVLGVPGDPQMLNNLMVRQSLRGAIMAKAAGGGANGPGDALDKVATEVGLKPSEVGSALDRFAQYDLRAVHHHQYATNTMQSSKTTSMQNGMQQHGHGKH
ncbi:MAG: hypothetical protein JO091_01165 [Acidobacteriaceae bacterium]|nr:hypothetical protein [Acidobacteriaceae bacterium]